MIVGAVENAEDRPPVVAFTLTNGGVGSSLYVPIAVSTIVLESQGGSKILSDYDFTSDYLRYVKSLRKVPGKGTTLLPYYLQSFSKDPRKSIMCGGNYGMQYLTGLDRFKIVPATTGTYDLYVYGYEHQVLQLTKDGRFTCLPDPAGKLH